MAEASKRGGGSPPRVMQHVAGSDITAGDIVLIGNTTGLTNGVALTDIANTETGTLEIGGGVYDCMVASNYAAGSLVYKPSANAILTTTSTSNSQFGFTIEAAAAANAVVKVLHHPYVPT